MGNCEKRVRGAEDDCRAESARAMDACMQRACDEPEDDDEDEADAVGACYDECIESGVEPPECRERCAQQV